MSTPNRHPFSARLRYAFDNYMARGTVALIFGLFLLSLLIIVVVSIARSNTGTLQQSADTQGIDLAEMLWRSMLRTLDPGTMGGDTGTIPFVLSMLLVTLGGIFVISTLIGVLSSGIEGKLDELRKGHSKVLESNHTVILGWSRQIFEIISEIVLANANQRRQHIVVLADREQIVDGDMQSILGFDVTDAMILTVKDIKFLAIPFPAVKPGDKVKVWRKSE